jgi:hypothetical protein
VFEALELEHAAIWLWGVLRIWVLDGSGKWNVPYGSVRTFSTLLISFLCCTSMSTVLSPTVIVFADVLFLNLRNHIAT